MKILMLLDHEFPPDIRVENEIQSLNNSGNEVHIACFTQKNRDRTEVTESCIIHRESISQFTHKTSVGAIKFPIYFNFWRRFLTNLFQNIEFDAIHVHDLPLAKIGYEFAKIYNAKFILDLHENWPALLRISSHTKSILGRFLSNDKKWSEYELKYCQLADKVIVVVDEAKERLKRLGINSNKIVIVSNTLNLNNFEIPITTPEKEFITLLYAGGITKHRGLQYVIKGIKHVKDIDKELRIWILGAGSYVNELKRLSEIEGVKDKVFFKGWKNYKEIQEYFGKSDYCLIPHVKNDHTDSTIPHKIFQYMYAGKPMLVSNCEPLKRIIEETNSGLTYEFDSPKDFANKLELMIKTNRYASEKFALDNKRHVVNNYNWEIDSKNLNSIYI